MEKRNPNNKPCSMEKKFSVRFALNLARKPKKLTFKFKFIVAGHKIQQYTLTTSETSVVETTDGKVKGVKRRALYGETYYSFENIPFGKPPIGELRFKAPQPTDPWDGVRDCTSPNNKPLQQNIVTRFVEGSEDCLYLNVYAKNLISEKPLPVMVWIYGGGFQGGDASRDIYSPDYFMKENIILVSITYRVGPLGFLSLKDPTLNVPGNAGLKDQVLALKWVKKNIKFFNGDPNNITVFGESAGGASTHFMMITDQTKGLFQKAIIQSGNAVATWATTPYSSYPYRLAKAAGYTGDENEKQIFEFLKKCDGKQMIYAQKDILTEEEKQNRILLIFGPVVEPYITEHCVVPKQPIEMMKTAWSNNIPLIIGACSFEGLFCIDIKKVPHRLNTLGDCQYVVPLDVCDDRSSALCKELGLKLKRAYFGEHEPSMEHLFSYLDLMSYKLFWHSIHRTVLSRTVYSSAPTYLYRFDFDSPFFNHFRVLKCGSDVRGVGHADDLSYLFYSIFATKLSKDTPEYKTIERMTSIWSQFAATGDPNIDAIKPVVWTPAKNGDSPRKCLNISEKVEFIDLPETEKLKVWDSFYSQQDLY